MGRWLLCLLHQVKKERILSIGGGGVIIGVFEKEGSGVQGGV